MVTSRIFKEPIPGMWLAGRQLARQLEGMDPLTAYQQAIDDWNRQEWLELKCRPRKRRIPGGQGV